MKAKRPAARTYLLSATALLVLLALTIGAAYANLGPLNTVVAMAISVAKAAIILFFFMHLRYSKPATWIFAFAGVFWLAMMFAMAMSDYLTRS